MIADDEDDRNLRRISYLRATKDERMVVDCSEDEEPNVPTTPKHRYKTVSIYNDALKNVNPHTLLTNCYKRRVIYEILWYLHAIST